MMTRKGTTTTTLTLALLLACLPAGAQRTVTGGRTEGPGGSPVLQAGSARAAVGTVFLYQGTLEDAGTPANGTYDFRASLWDDAAAGTQVGTTLEIQGVTVTDGRFELPLDFGAVYDGNQRFLELEVRQAGTTTYTTLTPRFELTPTPHALWAATTPWSGISGMPAGFADGVDDGASYTAGDGISISGTTIAVRFGGSGSASQASRSDHDHVGQTWTVASGTGLTIQGGTTALSATGGSYGLLAGNTGDTGAAVFGSTSSTTGQVSGVQGSTSSTSGTGVTGLADATSGTTRGVEGDVWSPAGTGVYGANKATSGGGIGVEGYAMGPTGIGVSGSASHTTGGVIGVKGTVASPDGTAVWGTNGATSGTAVGIFGRSDSPDGIAVNAYVSASTGQTVAVLGNAPSSSGTGVKGVAPATSGSTIGVFGTAASPTGYGVSGTNTATTGNAVGVFGRTASSSGYAGYFDGNVHVTGTLTAASKSFVIDDPRDPGNRVLVHASVESSERIDLYSGTVVLDEEGQAWIELPDWFEAINTDVRYQLTTVGAWAPVYVADPVAGNRFRIAGGTPGLRVCWQLTAVRHDPWAEAHPLVVEQPKPQAP